MYEEALLSKQAHGARKHYNDITKMPNELPRAIDWAREKADE